MLSDDVETAQTIYMMDALAFEDAGHRLVVDATHEALRDAGRTLRSSPAEKACAIYWWLKRRIRYVPTPGTNPLVDQTLIPPATLLSMPDPEGDCPQFSMLAAAMLRVCCVPSRFKTIAADQTFPDLFSHVYNVVQIGPDQFMPFDSSNGPQPGAEFARPHKTRVWPPVAKDRCKEAMTRNALPIPSFRNRLLRAQRMRGGLHDGHLYQTLNGIGRMGDDGSFDTTPLYSSTDPNLTQLSTMPPGPTYLATDTQNNPNLMTGGNPTLAQLQLAPAVPAGTAGTGTGLFQSLAADATALLSPVVRAATQQAPYYVTNPTTGQSVLYNPNTGTTSAAGSFSASLASMSPTTLLIVGVGLIALFAMGKK